MIVLTLAEALQVRGKSPNKPGSIIEPIPLKNGLFMLGEQVLNDPANADIKSYLEARSGRVVNVSDVYQGDEVIVNPIAGSPLSVRAVQVGDELKKNG